MNVLPTVGRLRFLNALRILAALWVVQAHCILWGGFKLWFPNPQLAVNVFMVLSGVLMVATVENREAQQPLTRLSTWLTFYSRRFFRLAPLYYVCLAVAVLASTWFIGGYQVLFDMYPTRWGGASSGYNPAFTNYSTVSLLLHMTFLFGLLPHYVFSTMFGDWSLSLEMQFYFVFPALLLLARRFGYVRLAVTLTGLGLLCRYAALAWYIEPAPLPFLLDYFLIGMLLHEAIARERDWLVGVCLLIISLDEPLYGHSVLLMAPFVLTIWAMGSPRWSQQPSIRLLRRCLENRLFDLGADLSYGLYLIHGFFISAAGLLLFQSARFLSLPAWERLLVMSTIVLTGSAAISYLAHVLIERPGIRFGALLSKRLGRQDNFSAAEAAHSATGSGFGSSGTESSIQISQPVEWRAEARR